MALAAVQSAPADQPDPATPQGPLFADRAAQAIHDACNTEGLELPLVMRSDPKGKPLPVKETLTFGPDTQVEVIENPATYDLVFILDGTRYQTMERHHSGMIIREASNHVEGTPFKFPEDVKFRTSAYRT